MTPEQVVATVIELLNTNRVAYMLTGSLASNLYAIPRSTLDADFVVSAEGISLSTVLKRLPEGYRPDPQMLFETVTCTTRIIVDVPSVNYKVEFFLLSEDAHDRERFQRRLPLELFGMPTHVPTAEDVLIGKLRWLHLARRSKDLNDVRNVISVSGNRIEWAYVQHWCEVHGTLKLLEDIRQQIPPM